MEPGADERTPGAAVTAALCGHWEHDPLCPLAPHFTQADRVDEKLHVRVLFAAELEADADVRRRIELAISGGWQLPDGLTTPWVLLGSGPGEVSADEADHAQRLVNG